MRTFQIKENSVSKYILDTFRVLSTNRLLNKYFDRDIINISHSKNNLLLRIDSKKIETPVPKLDKYLQARRSPLDDMFLELELLQKLIRWLTRQNSIKRLNHVGFCYQVDSQQEESQRLKKYFTDARQYLAKSRFYENDSYDLALWLYIGNKQNWKDPMIELLPVEENDDPFGYRISTSILIQTFLMISLRCWYMKS